MPARLRVATSGTGAPASEYGNGTATAGNILVSAGPNIGPSWAGVSALLALLSRLSRVRYADVITTVPLAQQNGSEDAPFASLQDAVMSALATGSDAVVLVVNGLYGDITVPPNVNLWLQKIGSITAGIAGAIFSPGANGTCVCGVITLGAGAGLFNDGVVFDRIDSEGGSYIELLNLNKTGPGACISPASVTDNAFLCAKNCNLANAMAVRSIEAENCNFNLAAFTHTDGAAGIARCYFRECSFLGAPSMTFVGAPGTLGLDTQSDQAWMNGGGVGVPGTIVNGAKAMVGRVQAVIAVNVPGVLVGQVGYVDVDPAGTALAGLQATGATGGQQAINWNPQDDIEAAGAGGGMVNARVYDSGGGAIRIRCAFIGPTGAAAHDVLFWTS